jgi:hypothetical protein
MALYALKFAGKLRLNCSAMPRPMCPTQFTVFTNASASALRMSPRTGSGMAVPPVLAAF